MSSIRLNVILGPDSSWQHKVGHQDLSTDPVYLPRPYMFPAQTRELSLDTPRMKVADWANDQNVLKVVVKHPYCLIYVCSLAFNDFGLHVWPQFHQGMLGHLSSFVSL